MKKNLTRLLVALLIAITALGSTSAFAAEPSIPVASSEPDGGYVIQAEMTEWVFWVENNILWKRLWSITYNVWLTDPIYVGPV